jgi:hypothetical protein
MTAPTSSSAAEGHKLLEQIGEFVSRFVILRSQAQVTAISLWVVHSYAIEAAYATPYLLVTSPEKRSGKSRLLEVLELLVRSPWRVVGVSEAALFRKIAAQQPTLLLDEIDAIFEGSKERNEPIRAVLNAGNRKGANVARCVGQGTNQHVEDFLVFCAKVLAGIDTGRLPDTVLDRSIAIRLARKTSKETAQRFRFKTAAQEAETLCAAIAAWVDQHAEELLEAEPKLPEQLNDRAWDAWEPLLAIADLADTGEEARKAAIELAAQVEVEDDSLGVQLLFDIHVVFKATGSDTIASRELVSRLRALPESPWETFGARRADPGLNQRDLARHLRPFGVKPRTVRVKKPLGQSETAKGYHRDQFVDAWERYLPPDEHAPPSQPSPDATEATEANGGPAAEPSHPADGAGTDDSPGHDDAAGVTHVTANDTPEGPAQQG